VLVHLIDVSGMSGRDPVSDLDVLRRELTLFDEALASKPQVVVATKMDAVVNDDQITPLERRAQELGLPFFRISSAAGTGLDALLEGLWEKTAGGGRAAGC
jgi:GTPase